MDLRRGICGLAAFSPLLGLGALGWMGRATLDCPPQGDSRGYQARLLAYQPFVRACSRLETEVDIDRAIASLPPGYPAVESSSEGVAAKDDVRWPIVDAANRLFRECSIRFKANFRRGDYQDAAAMALSMHRASLVIRYFDFTSFMASGSKLNTTANCLRTVCERLTPAQLAAVRGAILKGEAEPHRLFDLMRNDLTLLDAEYRRVATGEGLDPAIPKAASQAIRQASHSGDLQPFLDRLDCWRRTADKDRLWPLVASWQILLRREQLENALVRNAVGMRNRDGEWNSANQNQAVHLASHKPGSLE
jgi:hypothetical protein